MGVGPSKPRLVLILQSPGVDEDEAGIPVVGKTRTVLDPAMEMAGTCRGEVYIDNCVRCHPPHDRQARKDEFLACHQRWGQDIEQRFRDVPWVLLGAEAIALVGGAAGGVESNRGRRWRNAAGIECWGSYHPAAVLRGSGRTDIIAEVLARALGNTREVDFAVSAARVLVIDTETDGLDVYRGHRPFLASTCRVSGDTSEALLYDLTQAEERQALQDAIDNAETVVFHNARFDIGMLRAIGISVPWGCVHDTRWSAALADNINKPYKLETLCDRYFERGAVWKHTLHDWLKEHKKESLASGFRDIPSDILRPYATEDAVLTWALYHHPSLVEARTLWGRAYERERRLLETLDRIEGWGILVDAERVPKATEALNREVTRLHGVINQDPCIQDLVRNHPDVFKNNEFNPSSFRQTVPVCEALGIPTSERTKTGAPSYGKWVLSSCGHPIGEAIHDFRSTRNIAGGALQHFVNVVDSDGRVHPSYDSVGSESGRFTGTTRAAKHDKDRRINLMGIPRLPEVRRVCVATPGFWWVRFDFRQTENRGLAEYSSDEALIAAYCAPPDIDFYKLAGLLVYHRDVSKEERQVLKSVILARGFGAGVKKIAKMLRRSIEWTQAFLDSVDAAMPGLPRFFQQVRDELKVSGRVVAEGFPCRLDWRVAYMGVNRIVQGSCAAHMKRILIDVDDLTRGEEDSCRVIHHVHDEINLEIAEGSLDHWLRPLVSTIEDGWGWKVPVRVGIEIGRSWGDLEDMSRDIVVSGSPIEWTITL